jgi:hypothetical protein
MGAFEDAADLVQHAEMELPKLREAYQTSLNAKTINKEFP